MADYSRLLIDDEWMIKLLYTRIKTVMKRTHFCRKEQTSCYFSFKCMCLFWRSSLHSVGSVIYWWRKPTIYERWTLCIGSPLANLIKRNKNKLRPPSEFWNDFVCYFFFPFFFVIRLICFQFVSNITLGAFMRDESAAILEAKLLCRLATDVLQALRFIHQCGICHNNINIDSILIQKDTGRVRNRIVYPC